MNGNESLDVAKIINLIMENPKLIEEISNLAKGKDEYESSDSTEISAPQSPESEAPPPEEISTVAPPTYKADTRGHRNMLLTAFKPYVSKERARAIDSMISIVDILDMMKTR